MNNFILGFAVFILALWIIDSSPRDLLIYDNCVLESTEVTNDLETYCKAYTRQYLRYNK